MPSAPDITVFLLRLAAALDTERVRFTWKADDEIATLGWSRGDALDQLLLLASSDLLRTEPAREPCFTTIWVFCPLAWELDHHLWIRLSESDDHTFLISFHLAEGDPWT